MSQREPTADLRDAALGSNGLDSALNLFGCKAFGFDALNKETSQNKDNYLGRLLTVRKEERTTLR